MKLDEIVKSINNGDDHILVFTDESYVNTNHGARKSYLPKEQDEKSGLKCKHVIAPDGPLCNYEEDGITPVDDLKWNGDTCHPTTRTDGKLTCETLWVSHSHTGDYHNNMTLEMFMLWIKNKLCPCFAQKYPGKKMILITDNAPYHHAREITSLASSNI